MSIPGKPATHENGRGGFGASRFPPISPLRPEGMNKSTSAYEAGSSYEGDCTIGFWGDKELGKSASALDLDDWSICERQTSKLYESDDNKFGFWEASAVNTLNMLGKGPFITVPYLLASTVPSGPQALIGYALAGAVCMSDSTIWGELSSKMPYSGGSYIYLREAYGKDRWGRFMAYLFVFQFLFSAPIEIASGFIAMANYISYITGAAAGPVNGLIACGFCIISIMILYQDITCVGKTTLALWLGAIAAVVSTVVAGAMNFNPYNVAFPPPPLWPPSTPGSWAIFVYSLGTACRIGVYDFAGYSNACQMGDEVKNPRRTLPLACVWTCVACVPIFLAVIICIIGVVPWFGLEGFVEQVLTGDPKADHIMSTFAEILFGRPTAILVTVVVMCTIFGSCLALLLVYTYIPYSAARDGYFYEWFGHEHSTKKGLADYSLLVLGGLTIPLCFVDLGVLIEGMLTTRLVVQFIAQAIGAVILRWKAPNAVRKYEMPLFPLPVVITVLGCLFVFFTTSNWLVSGSVPLLEIGVALLLVGSASYLPFARVNGFWPFDQRAGETGNSEMSPPSEKAGGPGRAGGRGIKATPSTPEGQAPNSSRPTYYPSSAEQQTASSSPSSSLGRSSHPQTYPHKPR